MEQQTFVHDLCQGKLPLYAYGCPLPFLDVGAPHDPARRPPEERFHEGTFEPAGRVEDAIFTGGGIEAVLRRPARSWPEEYCTLSFAMDPHNNLASIELCREQA